MVRTLRTVLVLIALGGAWGCAPNQNGVWQPALPWSRQPAQASANPWSQPNGTAGTNRSAYISELMKRADEQNKLAESQRKQIEELGRLQVEQQKYDKNYIAAQRAKERAALEKQFAEKESKANSRYEQLHGRASDLDSNNRDLHARLASSEQRSELLQDEIDLLKQRLRETTQQLTQTRQVNLEADRRLRAMQASASQRQGQASIRANSSQRAITAVSVRGLDIRQDNDLVRISVPSERLFVAGSASLHQGSQPYLDQIAQVVREYYTQQMIGIEAHTDQATRHHDNHRGQSRHRLTVDQSMAVLEQLTARNLAASQLFVIGHGANHPLVSGGTVEGQSLNQRVEVVIYPETIAR